jgi:hypothetical protein
VHPTQAVRPVGCWAPKDSPIASSADQRTAATNPWCKLETGKHRMEVASVDAVSTIVLLMAIEDID